MRTISEHRIDPSKMEASISVSPRAVVRGGVVASGRVVLLVEDDVHAPKRPRILVAVGSDEPVPPRRFLYVMTFFLGKDARHLFVENPSTE